MGSRATVSGAALALLVAPAVARAHVMPDPPFVQAKTPTEVSFATLNERGANETVSLQIDPPPGVELVPEGAPPGWTASDTGAGVRWSGGRITGSNVVSFPTRVTASVRAGGYAFRAVQGYGDGRSVRWESAFTVLPAPPAATPDQHLGRAIVAGVVGAGVVVLSLLGLHLLRRRRA